ncbi:bactericidal permeability-increasing protein-like [Notamacropus eugenii]|uniref:bactericidal permeability-increasing protein-like n=1 Tax=Notamacropus eugenii TaxID=9315 RepID=UPI003B67123F
MCGSSPPLLTVKVNVDGIAGIDCSLMQPPKFKDDHVDISLKGQCYGLTHHTSYSFPSSAVNFRSSQLQMVYFGVSHSFFDSAIHVYKNAGIKYLQMSSSMVPKDSEYILSTDYYGIMIPQVSLMQNLFTYYMSKVWLCIINGSS